MSDYPPPGGQPPEGWNQPPGGYGPPPGPYGGGYPQGYGYGMPQQDHPDATTVLVLGILGLVVCGIIAPFAWSKGNKALQEIEASGRTIGGHGMVQAGRICGIVGTILLIFSAVFMVIYLVIVIGVLSASA